MADKQKPPDDRELEQLKELEELKARLDEELNTAMPDLTITEAEEAQIRRDIMAQLKREFFTLQLQIKLNEKIGRTHMVEQIERQLKEILTMLRSLESGEI